MSRNDISKIEEGSQLNERESLEKQNSTLILTEDDEDTRTQNIDKIIKSEEDTLSNNDSKVIVEPEKVIEMFNMVTRVNSEKELKV